jgi:hypothetical protein
MPSLRNPPEPGFVLDHPSDGADAFEPLNDLGQGVGKFSIHPEPQGPLSEDADPAPIYATPAGAASDRQWGA